MRTSWLEALLPYKEVGLKSNECHPVRDDVSDYLELAECVYKDATAKCTADVSDLRDLKTIRSRVKDEGLSFLTITLPKFCRDFESCLEQGRIDPTLFRFWKRGSAAIPTFLQGITGHIFDRETGRMINNELTPIIGGVSNDLPTLVESVRQICLTFKKMEVECAPQRVAQALDSFVEIEQSLETFSVPTEDAADFLAVSSVLWGNMVADIQTATFIPKHGPGATAERVSGNQKFVWGRWHERLEPYFPVIDNGYPLGVSCELQVLKNVTFVPEEEEEPVRVVPVPKTLSGPRIIAIEPSCMQYVQQGIRDYLYGRLESYWLTRGHINFRDQTVNQRLAMTASLTGQFATIDLSDASDRVPRDLALEMFRSNPDLRDAIDACRSTAARLPDGRIVSPLRKFASMGSALCFPVEAMYFYTVCVVALLKDMSLSTTFRNVKRVSRMLYVYGDDIVVPSTNAGAVLEYLRKYNCKVNTSKTFVSGSFRESCGIDAFQGYEVTPTYLRKEIPKNRRQASQLVSWVATGNLFYKKGYWRTAQFIFSKVERILGSLPYVSESSGVLGRFSYLGYCSIGNRWNSDLQRLEIKAWVPSPVYRTDKLEGYGALMNCFQRMMFREGKSNPEEDGVQGFQISERKFVLEQSDLERSALHGAVTLKRRWVVTT